MDYLYEYRVHPSVGIARMGNSDTSYFLTAEKPMYFSHDGEVTPTQSFDPVQKIIPGKPDRRTVGHKGIRDADGHLCKQGAKFRVFCYQYEAQSSFFSSTKTRGGLTNVWECKTGQYDIRWTVQVANLKSTLGGDWNALREANQPAAVTVGLADAGVRKPFTGLPIPRLALGSCFTDSDGNLTVLGSDGKVQRLSTAMASHAEAAPQTLYWVGYEDDAADGPVRAHVSPKSGGGGADAAEPARDAIPAWVVVGLPDYAPDVRPATTLYDVAVNHAYDMQNRKSWFTLYMDDEESPDTAPLKTYFQMARQLHYAQYAVRYTFWPHGRKTTFSIPAFVPVEPAMNAILRPAKITDALRPESIWKGYEARDHHHANAQQLPAPDYKVLGMAGGAGGKQTMPDLEFTSITQLQQEVVSAWAAGTLVKGSPLPETGSAVQYLPYQLDRAHLESMSGGSFFPGIEVGRTAFWPQTWRWREGACPQHFDTRIESAIDDSGKVTGPAAAGYLTKDLACPWHADFWACSAMYWPHSRPDWVQMERDATTGWKKWATGAGLELGSHAHTDGTTTYAALSEHYWKLGFVQYEPHAAGGQMIEKGRAAGFAPEPI